MLQSVWIFLYWFFMSKKQLLFQEIQETIWNLQSSEELALVFFEKRNQIRDILASHKEVKNEYQNGNHTNWFLFLADYRESLGIPKFMDLDLFNALSEIIMTSGEEMSYDDFLKVFKKSYAFSQVGKNYQGPEVGKLIKNQWEYLAQWLVEIVANAIDATLPDSTIGRFWEWFYQSLKFLQDWKWELIVQTKKQDQKGFQIHIKNKDSKNYVGSVAIEKEQNGTKIQLKKTLSSHEQAQLISFVIHAFQTNKKVNIILNGNKINKLESYHYYNGEYLSLPNKSVFIEVNEYGFSVTDTGMWMSSKDLCEKLLYPTSSGKKRVNPDAMNENELDKNTLAQTAFFYKRFQNGKQNYKKNHENITPKTHIRLQVWGVLIEYFDTETSYDVSEFCLEFPTFTWLPESRNKIELTKEVVVSLWHAIEKITTKVKDEKEQLMLLEIVGKIITHLKSRESSKASTKSKYDIVKVAKEAFKNLKNELQAKGKVVIASVEGIQDILPQNEDIVFVDEAFLNFEIAKIPGIQKLKNVSKSTKTFYQIDFSENAPYDYLILPQGVIVNAKYTKNTKALDLINAQVNLNTGYEHEEDKVFYGIIEDGEVEKEKYTMPEQAYNQDESRSEITYEQRLQYIENLNRLFDEFWDFFDAFPLFKSKCNEELQNHLNKDYDYRFNLFWTEISLNFYQLVFRTINGTVAEDLIPQLTNNFLKEFYHFALSHSLELKIRFRNFVVTLESISSPEKYLVQVMDLLSDEKNAKYIMKYLEELDNLSQSDIEKLFAHFEGIESEVEEEKDEEDIITKIYQESWENALELYLKSQNNDILAVSFKTDQTTGNGKPIYKIVYNSGASELYLWDELQISTSEPISLKDTFIYNDRCITVTGWEWKKTLRVWWDEFLQTYEITNLRLENNILHYHYSDVELLVWEKFQKWQIDLDEYFDSQKDEEESEYVEIYRDFGYEYFCTYIAQKKWLDGIMSDEDTCTIINDELAYTVFNAHNNTYSIYIWDELYSIDGITQFERVRHLMNFQWELVVECRILGENEDLYVGQYSYGKKLWGKMLVIQGDIIDENLYINYRNGETPEMATNKELIVDVLPGEESELLDFYRANGKEKTIAKILNDNPDYRGLSNFWEIGETFFYIINNKDKTESLYINEQIVVSDDGISRYERIAYINIYWDMLMYVAYHNNKCNIYCNGKKIPIDGKTDFARFFPSNFDLLEWYYQLEDGGDMIEYKLDVKDIQAAIWEEYDKLTYTEIYDIYGYDTLLGMIQSQHPEIESISLNSDIEGCDLVYESKNKNGTVSLYIWRQKLEFNGKSEFHYILRRSVKDGILKWLYEEHQGEAKRTFSFDLSSLKPKNLNDNKNDITKNYSQKVVSFVEFLCKWWEFLAEQEKKVSFESEQSLLLTDIIGISRHFSEEIEQLGKQEDLELLERLKKQIKQKLKNRTPFQRNITSTIDGQDRSSMIWLRESVQNSRDAIIKAKRLGKDISNINDVNIDFYQNNGNWITSLGDKIGMTSYEVFKYLLTPGKSGKEHDDSATGMFGQWFYSLTIGAKEVNLKTSTWDGKTTYIQLTPVYNDNRDIIDFEISYDITDEIFQGTLIERIDEEEWVAGNLWALVGIHNISKYVGNVTDVDIKYNGKLAINKTDITTLETHKVWNMGILSLKQNKDWQERLTKDNLFISELKDEYREFLPNWIQEYIAKNGYSLDLPSHIPLTKTRNAMTDFEENIELLRPYIFNVFTRQIIKDYLDGKVKIPMMPLDYYGLDIYETEFDENIVSMAQKVNNGWLLAKNEIETLQDKNKLVQYLIHLQVFHNSDTISIKELKQNRDNAEKLRQHTQNSYALNHNATSLNINMEHGKRNKLDIKKDLEKQVFLENMQKEFWSLTQRLFGCDVEFGFYERQDKNESRAVDYGFKFNGNIYFHFNDAFWWKYRSDERYKIIRLITHEYTHLVEKFVKWFGIDFDEVISGGKNFSQLVGMRWKLNFLSQINFWTHQKDLEHEHSFERIQRQMLKMMQREWL